MTVEPMLQVGEVLATKQLAKQEHGLKISEGKRPLSYQAYRELAKILFASDDKRKVAAHAFLTLEWNLIARAENCINCKIDHIYFFA